ncbi:integrase domain-containing protein [Citrobacter youngae]|uniref:integrase domain-containing protein n=1 Tax=Citrobacter youngae TaxID=133448 RepID=UPI0020209004|nr:integrase domain-containing protein [Citrobacter youngae]MCL7683105.1 integrase domain-containing protein [Citrobacter youngae]
MKIYRPLWSEGAFLAPQQFQQQTRWDAYVADVVAHMSLSSPWGVISAEFDESALTVSRLNPVNLVVRFPDGTLVDNRAITPEYYRQVLDTARAKDAGLAATLELARLMGLRSQEAVQCCQSLKAWKKALERGETRLTVVFGTKGHRPRGTVIQDAGAMKKALDNALAVAEERNGRLIDQSNLQKAMNYWRGELAEAGLTGMYTPHSLRYAWTQDAIRHHLAQGFSEKEALALTAMDLGHGDGRGRYVAQVYGRRDEE